MSLRRFPSIGDGVTVLFLAARVRGTIVHVSDDLHELEVLTEEGERIRFGLNRATARFVALDPGSRARLVFDRDTG